jgi:hypothetical protein
VQLRRRDSTAAIIDEVFSGGAAERAGLKLKGLGGLAQDPSAGLDICGGHGFGSAGA